MGLVPKTTDEMLSLIAKLREAGVLSYSYEGLVLTLHPPEARVEQTKEKEVRRSQVLGLTEEEQNDLFNEVADPVK